MQTFTGIVIEGKQRGRELGFPTINIPLADASVSGIYAAKVHTAIRTKSEPYAAAAFADPARGTLEAHLLDFSGDLYGAAVCIELHKKLRDSVRYESDVALRQAIAEDVTAVRECFSL
jgi:riboflavin kinase/FMN adenylyltransferase